MAIEDKSKPAVVMPMQPNIGVPDAVQALAGQPQPPMGPQMAENAATGWQGMPLRAGAGQFISPAGPLAVIGPAMFQNAMRNIGIKPGDYKQK